MGSERQIGSASGPVLTFAPSCGDTFANVRTKGPLAIFIASGAFDLTFA